MPLSGASVNTDFAPPQALLVLDTNAALDWLVFHDPRIRPWADALAARRLHLLSCPPMRDELLHMLGHASLARWGASPDAAIAAYDRHVGLAGDGSAASRAAGYRQLMERLAAGSASRFHMASTAGLLDQAEPSVERMVIHQMAARRTAEPDDELGRLAAALMQGNPAMASAAIEDHLILLSRYLDCPEPIRP